MSPGYDDASGSSIDVDAVMDQVANGKGVEMAIEDVEAAKPSTAPADRPGMARRASVAHMRRQTSGEPQDEMSRFKHKVTKMLGAQDEAPKSRMKVSRSFDAEEAERAKKQFRLETAKGAYDDAKRSNRIQSGEGMKWLCCGADPNLALVKYFHWTQRKSFTEVFLSLCTVWMTLITIFAGAIYAICLRYPTCMAGLDFNPDYFLDSWELSWTTLSTVGYGLVSQGTSAHEPDIIKCTGMTILLVVEAFIGILFAATCGAIVLNKVARIQSYAQVMFSDPTVIRYGPGVQASKEGATEDDDVECPILEFRIINRMCNVAGGEIVDAAVNLVASIDSSQATAGSRLRKHKKKSKKALKRSMKPKPQSVEGAEEDTEGLENMTSEDLIEYLNDAKEDILAKEEKAESTFQSKMMFAKLDVETSDHPFFKRVWTIRHKLDENSPLLLHEVREMIKRRNGSWPAELNNHKGVRAAVLFDQILVSMSGTSNADANSVYAQQIYNYSSVNVGYRFCNVLYKDDVTGAVCVDPSLLNDVMEQEGGGGEPFQLLAPGNKGDMEIL